MPRRAEFERNPRLEALIADLSRAIGPGGDDLAREAGRPQRPIVLVACTPRAGSTLFLQWLSSSGAFAVPSNILSRFWRAPAVGALVERLLFDPAVDFHGETTVPVPELDYGSVLGKTRGPRGPNEAWYLWRHFLGFGDPPLLGDAGRARADRDGFRGHLGAWEKAAGKPLALKATIAAWELPFVAEVLPTAVFVDLRRDPLATIDSLLAARERFTGDRRQWYSFRPPTPIPDDASPELQVALQVRAMRSAIDAGLSEVAPTRVLRLSYEAWCADPDGTWTALRGLLAAHDETLPASHPDRRGFAAVERSISPQIHQAWQASA